jgi:AcrR family transcriptional regulator
VTERPAGGFRRLPPGPHGIPPELVERNQRERLIAAMAEVCAERGYAESSVAEVAKRAGVSTASFYRQFKDRRECMLASFAELFERLLAAIEDACSTATAPGERARIGAGTAAALLAGDPPAARLLSVEILAVGAPGVRAQHEAIDRLAALLGKDEDGTAPSPDLTWAVVAACVALIARRSAEERPLLAAELEVLASQL